MPRASQSPAAPDAEETVKKHYTTLYAQLCMQAQHKYFSGKTLSGRGTFCTGFGDNHISGAACHVYAHIRHRDIDELNVCCRTAVRASGAHGWHEHSSNCGGPFLALCQNTAAAGQPRPVSVPELSMISICWRRCALSVITVTG